MLKKILAKYLSMVIIYQEKNIIKHAKHIQASNDNKKMNGRRKERSKTEYLLHECALLMKEYFRIQRSLFTFLKSKILYLQKRSS